MRWDHRDHQEDSHGEGEVVEDIPASEDVDQNLVHEIVESSRASLQAKMRDTDGFAVEETGDIEFTNVKSLSVSDLENLQKEAPGRVDTYRPPWLPVSINPRRRLQPDELDAQTRFFVFGAADDRFVIPPIYFPWTAICHVRVEVRNPQELPTPTWYTYRFASGFLVGPRHVVSASDVIPWGLIQQGYEYSITVTPAFWDGVSYYEASFGPLSVTIDRALGFSQGSSIGNPRRRALDFAIFRTNADIGLLLGYLDIVQTYPTTTNWYCAGYGLDREPLRPKLQYPVQLDTLIEPPTVGISATLGNIYSFLVSSNADGDSGNVGGPGLWWFNNPSIWEVNSVFSGLAMTPTGQLVNVFAGGAGSIGTLDKLVKFFRQNFP